MKFSNAKAPTSGKDYKGDPAGPGAMGGALVEELDKLIKTVNTNGNVKQIDVNLTFSYSYAMSKTMVELSASNGVQNVEDYLRANLKGINVNSTWTVDDEDGTKRKNVSELTINFK